MDSIESLLKDLGTVAWLGPSASDLLNNTCKSLHIPKPSFTSGEGNSTCCILHHLGLKLMLAPSLTRELATPQATELIAFLALLICKGMCSFASSDICMLLPLQPPSARASSQVPPPPLLPNNLIDRGLGLIREEEEEESSAVAAEVEGLGFRALGLKEEPSSSDDPWTRAGNEKTAELMRRLERKRVKLEMKLAEIDEMKRSVMEGRMASLPMAGSKRARVAGTSQNKSDERGNSVNSLYSKSARVAQKSGVRRDSFTSPTDSEDSEDASTSSVSSDPDDSGDDAMMDQGQQAAASSSKFAAASSSKVHSSNHPLSSPSQIPGAFENPRHSFDPAYPSLPLSLDDDPLPLTLPPHTSPSSSSKAASFKAQRKEIEAGAERSKVQQLKELFDRMHWNQPVYSPSCVSTSSFICELSLPSPPHTDQNGSWIIKSRTHQTKKAAKEEIAGMALEALKHLK